ncbi:unnamed protein product [Dibothriocephalus latus]|uniref:Fibronectin type-III domain-containing protein n=1 Tax=Dibothriocephalus latus TaxID=60516 RepID=A0A3P6U2Y0_DIBLA|nr:unnamed protein product [Dibothriocephalus latus]
MLVFEPNQLTGLGNGLGSSYGPVADPQTQIQLKAVLSTLPIESVGPVSLVTAYIENANQPSALRAEHPPSKRLPYLETPHFISGSYNNATWAPWEVVIQRAQTNYPSRLQDIEFTIGNASDSQTCDHCYNGPLFPGTAYRYGFDVSPTSDWLGRLHGKWVRENQASQPQDIAPNVATPVAKQFLGDLNNYTKYKDLMLVCIQPAEAATVGPSYVPKIAAVLAPTFGTLEVHWWNPSNQTGTLSSSTAIALQYGKRANNCSDTTAAPSKANCTLSGLRNYTKYEILVEACIRPTGAAQIINCTNSTISMNRTLPGAPDAATKLEVHTTSYDKLEVNWTNPSNRNGPLSSSKAFALLKGQWAAACEVKAEALSAASCLLKGLGAFTVYDVVVEVCTGPGGDSNYCKNASSADHQTLPGVFQPQELTALGDGLAKSDTPVTDPYTQISIKAALSTLPTEDVGPFSYVTAYIEPPSRPSSHHADDSLSRRRRPSENSPFKYGSYSSTMRDPWEVVILNNSQGVPVKHDDIDFIIGNPSDSQTCDHCYNGPLSAGTTYRIGLIVYTKTGAAETKPHEMSTSRKLPIAAVFCFFWSAHFCHVCDLFLLKPLFLSLSCRLIGSTNILYT